MRQTLSVAVAIALAATLTAQRGNRRERAVAELDLAHFTYRVETFPAPSLASGSANGNADANEDATASDGATKSGSYLIYLPKEYDDESAAAAAPRARWRCRRSWGRPARGSPRPCSWT